MDIADTLTSSSDLFTARNIAEPAVASAEISLPLFASVACSCAFALPSVARCAVAQACASCAVPSPKVLPPAGVNRASIFSGVMTRAGNRLAGAFA